MGKESISAFKCINIKELPTWVKVFQKDDPPPTKQEMLEDLTLIDDLLVIMKSQALLNRKRGVKDQLERRIAFDLGQINSGR